MRIVLPTVFTLFALASPLLYAAEDAFVGPSAAVGMSIGALGNKIDVSDSYRKNYPPLSLSNFDPGEKSYKTSTKPIVDLSWNWRLAPTWVIGAGANLEIGDRNGPERTISSSSDSKGIQSASLKMSQHAELYGLVGKQLGENWLLYGKLGYHRAKAESNFTTEEPNGNSRQNFNLSGASIGFGAAYKLPVQGLELRMEADSIAFNKYTHNLSGNRGSFTGNPSMVRANVMIGYRF